MVYKTFFVLILGIFFFSCTENENKTAARIDSLVSLPIPLDTMNENVVKKDSVVKENNMKDSIPVYPEIEGQVFYNRSYCGGARPTEEILAELELLKPLPNSSLAVKGKQGTYFIRTDKNGNFSDQIPDGTYDVFLVKVDKKIWDISANGCEDCLKKAITSIKIVAGKKAKIEFKFRCDPGAKKRP